MALDPKEVVVSSLHEAVLIDGGPHNYKQYASIYEKDHAKFKAPEVVHAKWISYYRQTLQSGSKKHKIFDAGCGTGLVGSHFADLLQQGLVEIYGGDLCPEMIELAKKKNLYADFKVVNLKEELPYEPETFDSITCSGVFLQGHCGPETVPHLARILKKGGSLVATVRRQFFDNTREEWEKQVQENRCEIIEESDTPYFAEMHGVMLVIRKL